MHQVWTAKEEWFDWLGCTPSPNQRASQLCRSKRRPLQAVAYKGAHIFGAESVVDRSSTQPHRNGPPPCLPPCLIAAFFYNFLRTSIHSVQNVFQILLPFSANVKFATGAATWNSQVAKATSGTKRNSAKVHFATGAATRNSQVAKATTGTKRDYVQNSIAPATSAIFDAIGNALGTKWKSTKFVQLLQFK